MSAYSQPELSEDAKEKLALYLATIMPHPSSGNRSSNKIYQRLVKNVRTYCSVYFASTLSTLDTDDYLQRDRFSWIGNHSWQMFRNQYCKNKRYYDKLIKAIVKSRRDESISASSHRQVLAVNKENKSKTVVEVDVPIHKRHLASNKNDRFENTFLIERKRKFADDISNLERKTKAVKSNMNQKRTIDEMLRAPLPPIVLGQQKGRSGRHPGKTSQKLLAHGATSVLSAASEISCVGPNIDIEDVEVGRDKNKTKYILADIWVDGTFRDDG